MSSLLTPFTIEVDADSTDRIGHALSTFAAGSMSRTFDLLADKVVAFIRTGTVTCTAEKTAVSTRCTCAYMHTVTNDDQQPNTLDLTQLGEVFGDTDEYASLSRALFVHNIHLSDVSVTRREICIITWTNELSPVHPF